MDILARDGAPLSSEEWAALDMIVVETARKYLVGRRFIPVFGPLGAGMPAVPMASLQGFEAGGVISTGEMRMVPLETLSQDFKLSWRNIETPRRLGLTPDYAPAAAAAAMLVNQEEALIFKGCEHCSVGGLLNGEGTIEAEGAVWADSGALFADVVAAIERLGSGGFPGPYAVVLSPATRAMLNRCMEGCMRTEMEFIREMASVHASVALGNNEAVVLEPGAQNVDLAIGMDMKTAYIGNEGMDHLFRILETAALRIKRPEAVVVIRS